MKQSLALISLVVRDYDEALAFFVGKLGFVLVEDSLVPEQAKRWVVVAPPGASESRLLLARASTPEQQSRIGKQTGGRVFLFLHTDNFWRDYETYRARGVIFVREPREEPYGNVALFQDLYGNLWDLVQPKPSAESAMTTSSRAPANSKRQVRILPANDSADLRSAYLRAFVDTACEHYQRYIATKQQFSDGEHYTGYVWDCLRQSARITYERFCREVVRHPEIYVLADDHSRDRVITPPLWPYPPYSVIALPSDLLLRLLPALPEDVYVFDASVRWTVGLTHEHDARQRICFGVGTEG